MKELKSYHIIIFLALGMILSMPSIAQKKKEVRSRSDFMIEKELKSVEGLVETDPLKSLDRLELMLKKYGSNLSSGKRSEIYHLIGKSYFNLEQYELSIKNLLRALSSNESSKFRSKLDFASPSNQLRYDLSRSYGENGNWKSAREQIEDYLDNIAPDDDQSKLEGLIQYMKSLYNLSENDLGKNIGDQALELANSLGNASSVAEVTYWQGLFLELKNLNRQAITRYNTAILATDSLDEKDQSRKLEKAISRNYRALKDTVSELEFKTQRRQKSIENNDLSQQNTLDLEIAELYLELDKPDEAIPFLQESVELSEDLGELEKNVDARKSLSNVYSETGDYNLALENYQRYVALVDELYQNKQKEIELSSRVQQELFEKQETISLLEKDQQLHESELALQEESIAFQKLLIYGLSFIILIILISAFLLYRNIQKKKLANQLLALKSLRSQLNPHFIFNALNSVNSFISGNDMRQANKYLSDFSRLMRIVLENSQKDFVPLNEELSALELYLKLEHFRFQDQFDYELNVDDSIQADEYKIPPMLIQPFIENSIWHGLRYKEDRGHLSVDIEKQADSLLLSVVDNGIGRKKSMELKTENQKANQSTGMKNSNERIALLNETYGSQIKCDIRDLENNGNTGTEVKVDIPLKLLEESI